MKLDQLLDEGVSDIVYHGTSEHGAFKILQSNTFRLNPDIASREARFNQRSNGPFYFLSTARTKTSDFMRDQNFVFVLNGRRLSQQYTGKSVDFFGRSGIVRDYEAEDRIYTSSPTIPNASRYIVRLDVALDFDGRITMVEKSIIELAQKMKIPVRAYRSHKAMVLGRNFLTPEELNNEMNDEPSGWEVGDDPQSGPGYMFYDVVMAIYTGRVTRETIKEYETLMNHARIEGDIESAVQTWMYYVSSDKKNEIVRIMRHHRLRSISDLVTDMFMRIKEAR